MKKNYLVSEVVDLEVPFYDVDAAGITWHGHYVKYFSRARWALMDKIDYDCYQMEKSGYGWPVVDMRIKYIRPTVVKQVIKVTASMLEYENRLKIDYLINDAKTDEKLIAGYTIQVAIDLQTKEMCYVSPRILLNKLQAYL